jgi:hypothetical protein
MPGQLLRETNPTQGFAPSLVPQHEDVNGDYKTTGEKNPLPVSVEDSGGAAQVDIQYRKQKAIQTHAPAVVAANGTANGVYIDTDGYNEIAVTLTNDAATANQVHFHWSVDNGATLNALEMMTTSTISSSAVIVPIKSRYVRVVLKNGDAAPHTMSAWAYLKV